MDKEKREKIMHGLVNCCLYESCYRCPYESPADARKSFDCMYEMMRDAFALIKAHEQFIQWLTRLVMYEDGEGAECEIICRRLHKLGYVEKYDENGNKYWKAVK